MSSSCAYYYHTLIFFIFELSLQCILHLTAQKIKHCKGELCSKLVPEKTVQTLEVCEVHVDAYNNLKAKSTQAAT